MNSLSNGFLYMVGYGWALTECALCAVAGNWIPLILFALVFAVTFAILGCLPLSDAAVNKAGVASSIILTVTLLVFTLVTFQHGAIALGVLKLFGTVLFIIGTKESIVAYAKGGHSHGEGCSHGHHH